jgi:glycosyltransferase involved in cell wall biosynthesis
LKDAFATREPLRILHLTAAPEAGGLSRYVLDLCHAMHQQGHHVAVASSPFGAWSDRFESAPWPWIKLPLTSGPFGLWRSFGKLRHYLTEHPVNLIHTHYRRTTMVARRGNTWPAAPILHTVHLPDIPLKGPYRFLSDFGDFTHAPSLGVQDWLTHQAHVEPAKVTVIPHGIDPTRFPQRTPAAKQNARKTLRLSDNDLVVAFVGRLDYPKNVDWMLDVALAAPSAIVLIAGDGPDAPALRQRIADEKLQNRFHMLGDRDPLEVYQAADALMLPSLREGFGLVCAEAMSVGVPVLRTQTAGTAELIIEFQTGRSVPIDHQAFVAAARDFLSDRAALERMGQAAADHVRTNFTFERQVEQTIELYRRITRRHL